MSTINKVFLDSSVLIEAIKGSQTALLMRLISDEEYECCISTIVVSEFMFYLFPRSQFIRCSTYFENEETNSFRFAK